METILIVDDDADLRWNLSNILKDAGFEAIAVVGGREALRAVERNSPNLVFRYQASRCRWDEDLREDKKD